MSWGAAWLSAWASAWEATSGAAPSTVARPDSASLTITAFAPSIMAGAAPTIIVPRFVTIPMMPRVLPVGHARVAVIGHAPEVAAGVRIAVPVAVPVAPLRADLAPSSALSVARGFAPTVRAAMAVVARPRPSLIVWRGDAPIAQTPHPVAIPHAQVRVRAFAPRVVVPTPVAAAPGALSVTAYAPTLDAQDLPFTPTQWTPDDESDVTDLLLLVALL